ncbi:MAG: response regulator [Paracoccaceae bacterium]|nr:MAG: response regulator [Paracoccaceae bacterium]
MHESILVVDDDDLVRIHVVSVLQDVGYRIFEAASGHEALDLLDTIGDVDLLLTDVMMPGGMNGRQLAEAALTRRPQMKVLYTSGYSDTVMLSEGRLASDVHLLAKPYRRQHLVSKVRQVLDS